MRSFSTSFLDSVELRLNPRGLGTKGTYLLSKNGDTLLREGSVLEKVACLQWGGQRKRGPCLGG